MGYPIKKPNNELDDFTTVLKTLFIPFFKKVGSLLFARIQESSEKRKNPLEYIEYLQLGVPPEKETNA